MRHFTARDLSSGQYPPTLIAPPFLFDCLDYIYFHQQTTNFSIYIFFILSPPPQQSDNATKNARG